MKIALTFSILATSVLLAVDNSDTDARSKIKPLQKDLIATLKEVADLTTVKADAAQIPALDALQIQRPLLEATLDAAETNQERISVLEKLVELQKKVEALAESSRDNLNFGYIDFLNAKAARIKAEIALEKEKLNRDK